MNKLFNHKIKLIHNGRTIKLKSVTKVKIDKYNNVLISGITKKNKIVEDVCIGCNDKIFIIPNIKDILILIFILMLAYMIISYADVNINHMSGTVHNWNIFKIFVNIFG